MNSFDNKAVLPLPLSKRIQERQSQQLPLAFLRRLGEIEDGPVARLPIPAADWIFQTQAGRHLVKDHSGKSHGAAIKTDFQSVNVQMVDVSGLYAANVQIMHRYWHQLADKSSVFTRVEQCFEWVTNQTPLLITQQYQRNSPVTLFTNMGVSSIKPVYFLSHFNASLNHRVWMRQSSVLSTVTPATQIKHCQKAITNQARVVPLQFYPVPLKPTTKPCDCPCGKRPNAKRLPLAFEAISVKHDASMLPLTFACKRRDFIPILKSYTMVNTITASVDGTNIQVLNASLKTDMDGFCWQGSISLYVDDFAIINMDRRERGNEAKITLNINGESFVFLAEDYSDNREFGQKTYTVTGRSEAAKLGNDYARTRSGTITSDLYARQIADAQIEFLPFTLEWNMVDWLVPSNSYSLTDKTPMDALMDIAQAAGGFVHADANSSQIHIRPRFKVPAWELQDTTADVIIPASVIVSISGQKRVNKRCNSIYVWSEHESGKGADVYRDGSDRGLRAAAQVHALYTDIAVHQAIGITKLSETGIHKIETVKLPYHPSYAIPRANLGEIWQFNEPNGYWKGIVTGIDISVANNLGAIELWQTLTIDRYMDV
ncbi:hypothetical protein [Vitreoscilla stercoraria]|uniref:Minor tail protein n=1 Tax=Vitreoscilla stercoraria TaxID=61 RepID=A0ABY4EED0_VITST|nr:hypothetical protein [Vitreoscilla stercoraria]UOO93574.1 hypothetical protein LVJ81_05995 [Vitreoscilla stercoraria]